MQIYPKTWYQLVQQILYTIGVLSEYNMHTIIFGFKNINISAIKQRGGGTTPEVRNSPQIFTRR